MQKSRGTTTLHSIIIYFEWNSANETNKQCLINAHAHLSRSSDLIHSIVLREVIVGCESFYVSLFSHSICICTSFFFFFDIPFLSWPINWIASTLKKTSISKYLYINLHNWLIIEGNYPIAKWSLGAFDAKLLFTTGRQELLCYTSLAIHKAHARINKSINILQFPIISSYFILFQRFVSCQYLNMRFSLYHSFAPVLACYQFDAWQIGLTLLIHLLANSLCVCVCLAEAEHHTFFVSYFPMNFICWSKFGAKEHFAFFDIRFLFRFMDDFVFADTYLLYV